MITVNSNTRQFNIPGSDLVFGVTDDSAVERKHFQCPRFVGDNLDLAACFIRINYRNANGKTDFYLVDDLEINGDNITFSWLLSPRVTEYRGQVKFVMCAVGPDLKLKWHTTQGTGQVMEGLEPDNSHVESQTADVVAQLIAMVEAQTAEVERVGGEQVTSARSAAENARMAAVNEIEAKRANSLASIPNDYTALSDTVESLVRGRGGAIVCEAEGTAVSVDDASDMAIQGMRIFGRSTQDGTPTPEAPVEIKSVESPIVRVCGKNLFDINTMLGENATLANGVVRAPYYRSLANIPVIKGQQYTISAYVFGTVANTGTLALSVQDGRETGYTTAEEAVAFASGVTTTPTLVNVTFTASSNFVSISANASVLENIMVVLGETTADFERYISGGSVQTANDLNGIPVTSGGNYTDSKGQQWICDEVDLERGVYVQRTKTATLTDGRNIGKSLPNDETSWMYYYVTPNKEMNDALPVLCDSLRYNTSLSPYNSVGFRNSNDGNSVIYFNMSSYMAENNIDALGSVLNEYPITFVYSLVKPIETPLTEAEIAAYRSLHSNYPNTTVLNDAGAHMAVKYAADTKLYIDKKIKEALQ